MVVSMIIPNIKHFLTKKKARIMNSLTLYRTQFVTCQDLCFDSLWIYNESSVILDKLKIKITYFTRGLVRNYPVRQTLVRSVC